MHKNCCELVELLRDELECEMKARDTVHRKFHDLNREIGRFTEDLENESKYEEMIHKQNYVNEQLVQKIHEANEKIADLKHSLKHTQEDGGNGKVCNINYECISKDELTREIKRFERMQIDLRSTLDRLQYRLDNESKAYYHTLDQFQKLQFECYYLQNLNERYNPVHRHHRHHHQYQYQNRHNFLHSSHQ